MNRKPTDTLLESLIPLPVFEPGWVWLTGAGPGDPGLITIHALNALKQADVIVYDALVDSRILELAKSESIIEFAGKRGGKPSPNQMDISIKLIEHAKESKRVLRLKGGDPFVFGRGGEEALALVSAGIPFRVIPGITAGLAGPAYAGIPTTHRDINQSVTLLTGHDHTGTAPNAINWEAVAKGSQSIIIYMAIKNLSEISKKLIDAGRSRKEPVAIICNATLANQFVYESNLGDCASDSVPEDLVPPAIVCIGNSVTMRNGLDWIGALSGKELIPNPLNLQNEVNTE